MSKKGGYKNIDPEVGKATQFPHNPINKKGRPRKLISNVIKELDEQGVEETTAEEIKSMYLRLMNFEIEELDNLVKNKKSPALLRIVGESILSGKGFDVIEKMLDRSVGMPTQKQKIEGDLEIEPMKFKIINDK